MNVGFYYMANAGGRLAGTVLSGRALRMARPGRLPLGIRRVRPRRGCDLAPPPEDARVSGDGRRRGLAVWNRP